MQQELECFSHSVMVKSKYLIQTKEKRTSIVYSCKYNLNNFFPREIILQKMFLNFYTGENFTSKFIFCVLISSFTSDEINMLSHTENI